MILYIIQIQNATQGAREELGRYDLKFLLDN